MSVLSLLTPLLYQIDVWLGALRHACGWQPTTPTIGKFYKRLGDCNQCGQCCKRVYLTFGQVPITSIAQLNQLKARYPDYRPFEPIEENETGVLLRCSHLTEENTCGIYETRPWFCRTFPTEETITHGGQLHQDCSYQFEAIKPFVAHIKECDKN
jgi:Fe-S-cluster containining protein